MPYKNKSLLIKLKNQIHTSDLAVIFQLFINSDHIYVIYDKDGKLNENNDHNFKVFKSFEELDNELHRYGAKFTLVNLTKNALLVDHLSKWIMLEYIIDFTNTVKIANRLQEQFYYINNPDKTIRWIYPTSTRYPSFLTLYNASGAKAALIKSSIKSAFKLGKKGSVASGKLTILYRKSFRLQKIVTEVEAGGYSIFTGTVGSTRKAIVEINHHKKTTHFIKVPLQAASQKLVAYEKQQLNDLAQHQFEHSVIPTVIASSDNTIGILSNVKPIHKAKTVTTIQPIHLTALGEWLEKTHKKQPIGDLPSFATINENMAWLSEKPTPTNDLDKEKTDALIDALMKLQGRLSKDKIVLTAITHTDFTPWNMYVTPEKIHIYDWEFSRDDMPALFDAFHFIFQTHILIKRSKFEKIKKALDTFYQLPQTQDLLLKYNIDYNLHYQYYHLYNVSYYLKRYMQQNPLHAQAHWLIDTWTEAINDL